MKLNRSFPWRNMDATTCPANGIVRIITPAVGQVPGGGIVAGNVPGENEVFGKDIILHGQRPNHTYVPPGETGLETTVATGTLVRATTFSVFEIPGYGYTLYEIEIRTFNTSGDPTNVFGGDSGRPALSATGSVTGSDIGFEIGNLNIAHVGTGIYTAFYYAFADAVPQSVQIRVNVQVGGDTEHVDLTVLLQQEADPTPSRSGLFFGMAINGDLPVQPGEIGELSLMLPAWAVIDESTYEASDLLFATITDDWVLKYVDGLGFPLTQTAGVLHVIGRDTTRSRVFVGTSYHIDPDTVWPLL